MSNSERELKAGVVLSYLTLVLSNVIALIYTPYMLRMMGQSEYGLYSLVASVVAYLTILDFGFGNAIVRFTAKYKAENRDNEQYNLFGVFFVLYLLAGIAALCIGFGLYFNVDSLFGKTMTLEELEKARIMMLLLIFNLFFTFPLSVFSSIVTAYERFVFQKTVNLIRIIIQPCIMVPLLFLGYKAIAMVVITTVLNLICLLINCWFCFFSLKIKLCFKKFEWGIIKEIINYSYFVFLTIIVDRAFWSSGQFILGIEDGTTEVAIFSIAVQLCMYYMAFSIAISNVFLPKMTRMVACNSTNQEISLLFIRIGRIQYFILGLILSGFVLFGRKFIEYWAGPGYESVYMLALVMMIPQTIPLVQNLGISILQAQNRQKFRSYNNLFFSLLSVIVGFYLSKKYGSFGVAAAIGGALLIGHGLILNLYYSIKIKLDVSTFWWEILKITLLFGCVMGGFSAISYFVISENLFIYILKIVLFVCIFILFFWLFGFNKSEKRLIIQPISFVHKFLIEKINRNK